MKVYVVDPWREIVSAKVSFADWIAKKEIWVRLENKTNHLKKGAEVVVLKGGTNSTHPYAVFRHHQEAVVFKKGLSPMKPSQLPRSIPA